MTATEEKQSETTTQAIHFPFGWRYVERPSTNGGFEFDMVPLTLEDRLHPQEDDQVTHGDLHQLIINYLFNVFRKLVAAFPSAVVLNDVLVVWDNEEIRPHGPDLSVIFGVREQKPRTVFRVAEEGTRPKLLVEVTSPETRKLDLVDRLEEYEVVGVEYYVIVDLLRRRDQITPRLLGYRNVDSRFVPQGANEQGRLWIEPLKIWLGFEGLHLIAYNEAGTPIADYVELYEIVDELREEVAETKAQRDQEAEARAEAERRIAELEAELRKLRGEA
jgi:Uma2 family endonuclease